MNPFQGARFVLAAAETRQLPPDAGAEIVFAGRSNAGKSSALNALTGTRALARTSKTPGRTQQLVVFELADGRRLVDLPGYGYAKVPLPLRARWEKVISAYLRGRLSLRGLVLIMDVRHPLKDYDRQLLGFCAELGLACHCLLSKADKLSRGAASAALQSVRKELPNDGSVTTQLFSAQNGLGVEEARESLAALLDRAISLG
ncbi:MAG TPA: ribosome biogenesis GTP-binding protein YihA/YsxC [Rhodanobacteraceae bacterium]|nr:ribosome biogenesis GTP-binding protein YihA/YsxC [Rhodanobacteraceae bacterium]